GRSFTVEKTARPRQLFAQRSGPDRGGQRDPEGADSNSVRFVGLEQYLRSAVEAGLVDPRLDTALFRGGPALAVEESRGPGEIVAVHSRDSDESRGRCL